MKTFIMHAATALIITLAISVILKTRPDAFHPATVVSQRPAPEPAAAPPIHTLKITAVGDLMTHVELVTDAYDKATDSYDFNPAFKPVAYYLSSADFTIGNLETTFAGKAARYAYYPTFNAPDAYAHALKNAGFDFLTTANNHSNDRMEFGIIRTLDVLDELGIAHMGTFRSAEERDTIYMKEINQIRFAILSYTYGTNGIPLTAGKPYLVNLLDEKLFRDDIARAKKLNPDFIIVLPHMGTEYETFTRDTYKKTAFAMLEAGADIVLASHPHVLQPAEFLTITDEQGNKRECFIAYSLGNFFSSQRPEPRDVGIIYNLYFEKKGDDKATLKKVGYIPTWVKFMDASGKGIIQIVSIFDALSDQAEDSSSLRTSDIARLQRAHEQVSRLLLNKLVPLEEIRNEYFLK